jgi:hypothetical protein
MLLPALSRPVGVISQHGGYRGTPSPSLWNEISETVCIDKSPQLRGCAPEFAYWHKADVNVVPANVGY